MKTLSLDHLIIRNSIIDIFIGYITDWVYQDLRPPATSVPKGNIKLEILLVKIFILKQKQNQIPQATIEKIKCLLFEKTAYGSFR